jgi:WXG100 family type VII secretion target
MPNGLRGGNLEEMHALAKNFSTHAKQLASITSDLDRRTKDSDRIWTGPAADRFRHAWQEAHASFVKMHSALDEASTAIDKQAQNIEAATR